MIQTPYTLVFNTAVLDWNNLLTYVLLSPLTYLIVKFYTVNYLLVNYKYTTTSSALNTITKNHSLSISKPTYGFMQSLWTFLILIPVLIWVSPEISFFGAHLCFTNDSLKSLLLLILLTLVSTFGFIGSRSRGFSSDNLFLVCLVFIQLVYSGFFFLSLTTNLVSFVFTLEFINLTVMVLLITFLTATYRNKSRLKSNNALIIFFWVNTLSSILLFILLVYIVFSDYMVNFNLTHLLKYVSITDLSVSKPTTLFQTFSTTVACVSTVPNLLLLIIILIKLGVPPFIFWKFFIFESAPLTYLYIYNVPYFILLFVNFLYLINIFGVLSENMIISTLVIFLSILLLVILANKTYSWGALFTVSSSFTSLLILLFIINTTNQLNTSPITSSISLNPLPSALPLILYTHYLALYLLTLLLVFPLLNRFNINYGSSSLTSLCKNISFFKSNQIRTRYKILIVLLSFAGLPPLSSFFAKLYLINLMLSYSIITFTLTLLFFLFILLMLMFYFKVSKFLLVNNQFKVYSFKKHPRISDLTQSYIHPQTLKLNIEINNFIIIWLLVTGFFFFRGLNNSNIQLVINSIINLKL